MKRSSKKPYTNEKIVHVKCIRCGAQATQQWNVCAVKGYWPICTDCDIRMNRLVLDFMGFKTEWVDRKIFKYKKKLEKTT